MIKQYVQKFKAKVIFHTFFEQFILSKDKSNQCYFCYTTDQLESGKTLALIYPKSHAECRDSAFDGQIND